MNVTGNKSILDAVAAFLTEGQNNSAPGMCQLGYIFVFIILSKSNMREILFIVNPI